MKTKKNVYGQIVLLVTLLGACSKLDMELPIEACTSPGQINLNHPKANSLGQKLDQIVDLGIPGVVMAMRDIEGTWVSASGLSKLETKTPMEICHLQFGQSVAKTYMATAILMLYEDGLIDLDEKITTYLPGSITRGIENADQATVRMLLNHTSGIAEYNDKPNYVTYLLQHPLHTFNVNDYLDYTRGASAKFSPGEKYSYTNTNYILLALIADEITGDHKRFIRHEILTAFELNDTYYHDQGFMEEPTLVNTYWDRYSNGKIENCSAMHRTNVGSLIGDDGIIATPVDFISFLELLLTHQILEESTMEDMLHFVEEEPYRPGGYGLGISQEFYKDHERNGHTGGGIGAACELGYFKDSDTYFFIGMNLGSSITPAPSIVDPFERILDEIYDIILE